MKQKPSASEAFEEIARVVNQIKSPHDYLSGTGVPASEALPGSILFFSRQRPSQLQPKRQPFRHQHHRFVLLTALQGSGRILLDAGSHFLGQGETLLFFPFQYHAYMDLQAQPFSWLFVTFEIADSAALEPLHNAPPRRLGDVERLLLSELVACWREPARHALLPLHLALLLARLSALGKQKPLVTPAASADAALLARLNAFLIPRLSQSLGVTTIAAALGISESHLRARFRNATGESLGRHLRNLRLQRASSLLHTTRLSVAEISERCGFDSLYSFSRAFKTERGISPRGYRQQSEFPLSPGRPGKG